MTRLFDVHYKKYLPLNNKVALPSYSNSLLDYGLDCMFLEVLFVIIVLQRAMNPRVRLQLVLLSKTLSSGGLKDPLASHAICTLHSDDRQRVNLGVMRLAMLSHCQL